MSKSSGYSDEVAGKAKENLGWATGNQAMEAEGKAQYVKGVGEVEACKFQERATGTGEQASGTLKETAGKAIGNDQMEVEGRGTKLKGDTRKAANQ